MEFVEKGFVDASGGRDPTAASPPIVDHRVRFQGWSAGVAWFAIVAPALLLIGRALGWFLDYELEGVIRVRTLFCVLVAGLSLMIWHTGQSRRAGRVLGALVAASGIVTLCYYATTSGVGGQDALYGHAMLVGLASPGRLSLPSSVIVTVIGVTLWALHSRWSPRWTEVMSLIGVALCLIAVIGHLYHADELFAPFSRRGIALAPSLMFGALCFGLLIARPGEGLVALVTNARSAGLIARGLLGPILLAPVMLGAVSLVGVRWNLYDHQLAMALVVVSTSGVLGCLVMRHAETVRRAEDKLDQLQTRLVQAHRIDAASYLAGWMCHEFNNLLTVIQGYTTLLVESEPPGDALEHATQVSEAASACAELTRQLLRFSSHEVAGQEHIDLAQLVEDLKPAFESILGGNTRISFRLMPGAVLQGNRKQLQHVFLQLALNARDAMPAGGDFAISVEAREVDARARLRVTVTDTGHGMTEVVRARAFEPFFTTRERGRGTGLGLSTVFGIVNQLDGSIDLQSQEGFGTKVTVELPATGE